VALTKSYFDVWNKKDVPGIEALHAASSTLKVSHEYMHTIFLTCVCCNVEGRGEGWWGGGA